MAGPTAAVLFCEFSSHGMTWREVMSDVADDWHDESLLYVSDSLKFGGNYRGDPQPFVGGVSAIKTDKNFSLTSVEIAAFKEVLGFEFTHYVELGAMCNAAIDHQLLCEIVCFLARKHDGFVDFNAVIAENGTADLQTVRWTEDGREYLTQIGTHSSCDWWLAQNHFHMVK